MWTNMKTRLYLAAATLMAATALTAQNPIICDRYTPDPAPYVHGDTLYLFVDHDEDVTQNNYFTMKDWLLYSTVDMVNWTYRGTPLTSATFSAWAKQDNDCWASQCIERNGKWYWYVTATIKGESYPGIGVAVADHPAGPYRDPIRKPLVKGWFKIDPSVFIDDNGQAYLFYGNNMLWYAKLNKNMTAITGGEIEVKTKDETAFGPYKGYNDDGTPKTNFEEASWVYKRGDKYYLEYAAGGVPEHWAYSTADKITGPWTYQGKMMGQADNSFTIHGGSVEYKGHHYLFYHNGKLPNGGGYKRATCIEEYTPNADGTLPMIKATTTGVKPLQTLNPYERQEAETINQCQGVKCAGDHNGCYVTNISQGDYIRVRNVDFGETAAQSVSVRVRVERACSLMVRTGGKSGAIKGVLALTPTGGEWTDVACDLSTPIKGACNLYFTFTGSGSSLMDFDSWQFSRQSTAVIMPGDNSDERLWYDQPAKIWLEALPVGNGRLGGMVYGGTLTDEIQLNEDSFWSGGPHNNNSTTSAKYLDQVRNLIFNGKEQEAEDLINQQFIKGPHGQKYLSLGSLKITQAGIVPANVTDYRRELDLQTAVSTVTFGHGGHHYRRTVFASMPDSVIVIRLEADTAATMTIRHSAPFSTNYSRTSDCAIATVSGVDHEGIAAKLKATLRYSVESDGEVNYQAGGAITVKDFTRATILVSAATNYVSYNNVSGNPSARTQAHISGAREQGYDQLLSRHVSAYQQQYSRVRLTLPKTANSQLPTNQRLERFTGSSDWGMVALMFNYGRYLLISSSQAGGQPANLQGLWNDKKDAPWDSKYTININTEMNYWPSEVTNLTETNEPLFRMIGDLSQTGAVTAKTMYGCGGWVAHHNTDLWRIA